MHLKKSTEKGVKKSKKQIEKEIELKLSFAADAWLAFENANLLPLEEYVSANQKWKSKCLICGSIVSPRIADVKFGRNGCKPCGTKKAQLAKFVNQEKQALKTAKKAKLEPLEPYVNAVSQWKCKCLKCGEIVTPTYHNLKQGNGGCIYCQKAAFKLDKPAYLYFIHHRQMRSFKIGIGNRDSVNDRLKSFIKVGWVVLEKHDFKFGKDALRIEKEIFKWLRKDLHIPVFLSNEQFSHGGSNETFSDIAISVMEVKNKLQQLIKGYKNNP